MTIKITGRKERAERLLGEIIKRVPKDIEVIYVQYDETLPDEQAQMLLDGEDIWEEVDQWYDENREYNTNQIIDEITTEEECDLLLEHDLLDDLRLAIQERDTSDPLGDLLRNTGHKLMSIFTGYHVPDWMRVQVDDNFAEVVQNMADALGAEREANRGTLSTMLSEASYGGELRVMWYGKVADAIGATSVTFTDPRVVILDSLNGSGMDGEIKGTVTLPVKPGHMQLDSQLGYGWNDIAGVHAPAYECDVQYTKPHKL